VNGAPSSPPPDQTPNEVDPGRSAGREEPKPPCPECAALEAELEEVRISRDDALLALAKERELLEALRMKHSRAESQLGREQPLRQVIVDQLNDVIKNRFQFLHLVARKLIAPLLRSAQDKGRPDSSGPPQG